MRLSLLLICIMIPSLLQAQVYRSVDKDGNVTYSDKPSKGSVEVEVKELETVKPLETAPPIADKKDNKPAAVYSGIEITSPQDDVSIRENTGNVSVTVSLNPNLKNGHKLVLYLDGEEYASGTTTNFQLQNIDRGSHQLRAAVQNAEGRLLISSKSITFHLHRFSALFQPPKAQPQAQAQ